MKASRAVSSKNESEIPLQKDEDVLALMVEAIEDNSDDHVVLKPEECCPISTRTDGFRFDSFQSLLLAIVEPKPALQKIHTTHLPFTRCRFYGAGVIAVEAESTISDAGKCTCEITYQAVPLYIQMTPWVPRFPNRFHRAVCDEGGCAVLGEVCLGRAVCGTLPEGWVAREAVVLVRGLPRCRVEAVSGSFPVFKRVHGGPRQDAEVSWELLPAREADPRLVDERAQAHLQRLEAFRASGLAALRPGSQLNPTAPGTTSVWVLVSYPDGTPSLPVDPSQSTNAHSEDGMRAAGTRSDTQASVETASDFFPFVSPLCVLPQSYLCQQFVVKAGLKEVEDSERETLMDALGRVRGLTDPIRFRKSPTFTIALTCFISVHRDASPLKVLLARASQVPHDYSSPH